MNDCRRVVDVAKGSMHRKEAIRRCLVNKGWLSAEKNHATELRFLAQGEYNENWLLSTSGQCHVLRINHGSQLGLTQQIAYEYFVLQSLRNSGVTPQPFAVDLDCCELGQGMLLMEFLPGTSLDYISDAGKAAHVFARIHAVPIPAATPTSHAFIRQPEPVLDIANESLQLIQRYLTVHELPDVGERLLRYHSEIMKLYEATRVDFLDEPQVIVNSEVNSGNFIVHGTQAWLVDWEKAVVSSRNQDLGHFLAPTTTLWKTSYRFTAEARCVFLQTYVEEWEKITGERLDFATLDRRSNIVERTILLRGLSWCFMAFHEYSQQERMLYNEDTFVTIKRYLDNIECFLAYEL